MTSLEIAEITGMRHADVMRAIRRMGSCVGKCTTTQICAVII